MDRSNDEGEKTKEVSGLRKKINEMLGEMDDGDAFILSCFEQVHTEQTAKRGPRISEKEAFNLIIGLLIVSNSIMLGIEVDYGRGNRLEDRMGFFVMDLVFFFAFTGEMLLRIQESGWDYYLDPWNFFDYLLVVMNCADLAISLTTEGSAGLKIASSLRIARVLRIVRAIKGIKMFYSLWIVILGMLESMRTMLWVALLLIIIIYCIAITLTTLVGQSDYVKEFWPQSTIYLGTVYRSMWTVLQLITFDNWADDVARPLAKVSIMGTIILFATIVVCSFGALNVIVAVMVEKTLSIARGNTEETTKILETTESELLKSMARDFENSGLQDINYEVGFDDFCKLVHSPTLSYKLKLLGHEPSAAVELFDMMDVDKSNRVSPEEFITGLQKLKGPAKGQDLVTLICFAQQQCMMASRYVDRVRKLSARADAIQDRLNGVGLGITAERRTRIYSEERNKHVWKQAAERQKVIHKMDEERAFAFPGIKGMYY
eukprot:TRINITY_DN5844_c0_g1_i1.p1 TRINITY_DN5844_c0_g1~~TRINITY_DN5844_c0_g1_i1.p1  ORF type:complete len:488 (+),score=151.20 TRINITY_DN5844_c0_g1_i1:123-1586(+)